MKRVLSLLLLLAACSSVDDPVSVPDDPTIVDGKADSGRWKSRDETMSVWLDVFLEKNSASWAVTGRTSRNIQSITGSVAGNAVETVPRSKRTFVIALTDEDLRQAAIGNPLNLEIETEAGLTKVRATFAIRFAEFDGDSDLFLFESINPVIVGYRETLRGRVALPDGWTLDAVATDNGHEAVVGPDFDGRATFDLNADEVPRFIDAPLNLVATDVESQTLVKTAVPKLKLVRLQVGDVLESSCEPDVADCLATRTPYDTEVCGYSPQVNACLPFPVMAFTNDLADFVRQYYDRHGTDIATREGRTLDAALARISPFNVHFDRAPLRNFPIDEPDAILVHHTNLVFRESPHVWYGAYRPDGTLIEMRLVNDILR